MLGKKFFSVRKSGRKNKFVHDCVHVGVGVRSLQCVHVCARELEKEKRWFRCDMRGAGMCV